MPNDRLIDTLRELATVTDWLAANLLPGTPVTHRPELSSDRRAELAVERKATALAQLLADRDTAKTRGAFTLPTTAPIGQSPVPFQVDVMDLLVEILDLAAAWSGLPTPGSALDDPKPHLRSVGSKVRLGHLPTDDLPQLEDACEDLLHRAYLTLGLVEDGQLLTAVCPWCTGRTGAHPEGGQRTLRIQRLRTVQTPSGRELRRGRPAINGWAAGDYEVRWYVVCESGTCEPPDADCGAWWQHRPCWDIASEGQWLAQRLEWAAAKGEATA